VGPDFDQGAILVSEQAGKADAELCQKAWIRKEAKANEGEAFVPAGLAKLLIDEVGVKGGDCFARWWISNRASSFLELGDGRAMI
jgi:hypothetical protein